MSDSLSIGPVQKIDYPSSNKTEINVQKGLVQVDHESQVPSDLVEMAEINKAITSINAFFDATASVSVSFSFEADLNRTIVTVRDKTDDAIVRQFPPEEFISVAKFIAAQSPEVIDEDYLKGILFDQHT